MNSALPDRDTILSLAENMLDRTEIDEIEELLAMDMDDGARHYLLGGIFCLADTKHISQQEHDNCCRALGFSIEDVATIRRATVNKILSFD